MKKLSIINENIFDGIGRRSKGGVKRKEDEVESVDLGLPSGTIWAACNLGASSPEEYGNYYAWGETKPKDKYDWDTYKFGTENKLTKYNKKDGKTILDPEDDAANTVLGGKWHMPTEEQIQELIDNTTNEHSKLNGVYGKLLTSKINGKELFFPYSGQYSDGFVSDEDTWSLCWSSSLYEHSPNYAMLIFSDIFSNIFDHGDRYFGYSVRGVLDKK